MPGFSVGFRRRVLFSQIGDYTMEDSHILNHDEDAPRVCASCWRVFRLSEHEVDWFGQRGFSLPKRCKPCRQKRRAEREAQS